MPRSCASEQPVSDSPPPEPDDADDVDDPGDEPRQPARTPLSDIEDGIGHLFAAFERGVLNIAKAEGDKRRGVTEPRDDAAHNSADDSAEDSADEPETELEDSGVEVEADRPRREPLTYDDVLTPIRWRRVLWGFVAVIVLVAAYFGATLLQVYTTADEDQRQPVDAIVVLGAAQFDGTPSPTLEARLDHAFALWQDDFAELIVTTGANQEGDRFTEGFSGFVYLRERGVPEAAIITVVDGIDTWEQLTATVNQLDERDLDSVLLVSDGHHSFRLLAIAEELGLEAFVSPSSAGATRNDYLREATAVSIGRIFGYRRLSNAVN